MLKCQKLRLVNWRLNLFMTNNTLEFAEEVLEVSFGFSTDAIWYNLEARRPDLSHNEKIETFCYIIKVAMEKGILKIASNGLFLKGSPSEMSEKFKSSFPVSEDKMSDVLFCLNSDGDFWTPGGGVWICSDGDEVWT